MSEDTRDRYRWVESETTNYETLVIGKRHVTTITEPEDRTGFRDLAEIPDELNALLSRAETAESALAAEREKRAEAEKRSDELFAKLRTICDGFTPVLPGAPCLIDEVQAIVAALEAKLERRVHDIEELDMNRYEIAIERDTARRDLDDARNYVAEVVLELRNRLSSYECWEEYGKRELPSMLAEGASPGLQKFMAFWLKSLHDAAHALEDDARAQKARVAALEAELKEAKALNAIAACSYCGFQCAKDGTQIKDHVLSCEKNPAVALATEVIAATSRAERAERVVAWLLNHRAESPGDPDACDIDEMLKENGYIVDLPPGSHDDCEWCENGKYECVGMAPEFARLVVEEKDGE